MTDRYAQMIAFLNNYLDDYRVESLAGDASFRRYHRIYVDNHTYLLMDAPPDKENVTEFVNVATILSDCINVPDIIARDMDKGFLLLQDFGVVEFAHAIIDDIDNKDKYYKKALQTLLKLQQKNIDVDIPMYSDEKLSSEMDLFIEWFLPYIGAVFTQDEMAIYQDFKTVLIDNIQKQPKVIVHRDYHSRNLMIDKASNELGVIDFQDAVIGAYSYDLVSLVRDAYINENEEWVSEQIHDFYHLKSLSIDLNTFMLDVNIMGIQRHLKVLGIFIRLSQRDGKDRYLNDIPKVMRDFMAELTWLNRHYPNQTISAFMKLCDDKVIPAYQTKFAF